MNEYSLAKVQLTIKDMTRDEQVQYWLDLADYDLDTAEAMHPQPPATGHWQWDIRPDGR